MSAFYPYKTTYLCSAVPQGVTVLATTATEGMARLAEILKEKYKA